MSHQAVHIFNREGEPLHGVLYPSDSSCRKSTLVLMCHGFKGDKSEKGRFVRTAMELNRHGFDVLCFDFSGSGENRRIPVLLSRQVRDLEDVALWAESNGYAKFGTVGLSFGGITSLMANLPSRKAAVFWSPAMYPHKSATWSERLLSRFMILLPQVSVKRPSSGPYPPILVNSAFTREVFRLDSNRYLTHFQTPSLILQGDADTTVNPEDTRQAFHHMPQDSHHRFSLIQGAAHDFNGDLLQPFIEQTVAWFKAYL